MKVLVVESELYLAQSITAKLIDSGYTCEFAATTKEALEHPKVDALLLSSSFSDHHFHALIEAYRNQIIILMVSYINADTVTRPMDAGASDYILKPFMIEELIRKIEHFRQHRCLKEKSTSLERYIHSSFSDLRCEGGALPAEVQPPVMVLSNHQRCIDAFAFSLAKSRQKMLRFHDLKSDGLPKAPPSDMLTYISGLESLRKPERQVLSDSLRKLPVVVGSTDLEEEPLWPGMNQTVIRSQAQTCGEGEIVSIEEYVKSAILANQHRFPDTELSRRLGISRKSLWEKRRKYGIQKN
jgi:DNA-binding NtrC family response regulator